MYRGSKFQNLPFYLHFLTGTSSVRNSSVNILKETMLLLTEHMRKCLFVIFFNICLYEEIFVLTFKAYGLNAVRSMHLECQNKYFPYGLKSRLTRALLYTYPNKTVQDETLLSQSIVYCVSALPSLYASS